MARSSSAVRFPAPGSVRSITYLCIFTTPSWPTAPRTSLCHDRVSSQEPELRMTANPAGMTETPDRASLDAALEGLRLEGALFLRAEYSEPWAYESLDGPATAALLR